MAGRAVHFALTAEDQATLLENPGSDNEDLLDAIGEIEERWDEDWLLETDKAWDAIHRCLTDGTLEYGETPLHFAILGKDNLHDGDEYLISYLSPEEVAACAAAIKNIDKTWMREKYDALDGTTYQGVMSDEDFDYTLRNFEELKVFYQKAAENSRSIVFTVDQ